MSGCGDGVETASGVGTAVLTMVFARECVCCCFDIKLMLELRADLSIDVPM